MSQTQWSRSISNNSRKFTTDIILSSTHQCPKMEKDQDYYEWFLQIKGVQTTIPLTIERIQKPRNQTIDDEEKINDINVIDECNKLVQNNKINEKERRRITQENINNKYLILKPAPNQIYKICKKTKWNEEATIQIIDAKISQLNETYSVLKQNGGLWRVLINYLNINHQNDVINHHNNLIKLRADAS